MGETGPGVESFRWWRRPVVSEDRDRIAQRHQPAVADWAAEVYIGHVRGLNMVVSRKSGYRMS
jgi:hypothetical protein